LIKESKRAERNEIRLYPVRERMIQDVNVPSFFKDEYERNKNDKKLRDEM